MAARAPEPTYYLDQTTQKALAKMNTPRPSPQKSFHDKFVSEYGDVGVNELIMSTKTPFGYNYSGSDDKMKQTFQMLKSQAEGLGLDLTEYDLLPVAMVLQGTPEAPRRLITGDPRLQQLIAACGGQFTDPKAAALGVASNAGELSQAKKLGNDATPKIKSDVHQVVALRTMLENAATGVRRINSNHARDGRAIEPAVAAPPPPESKEEAPKAPDFGM
jgi:hypothetical protein